MNNFSIASYDVSSKFGVVDHVNLDGFVVTLVCANHQTAVGADPVKTHFIGHWQVTNYATAYNDYQIVILWDAVRKRVVILRCLPHTAKGCHTWKRNTAAEGYSFSAMYGASPTRDLLRIANTGNFPVIEPMIKGAALYLAEYSAWHKLDLTASVDLPVWKSNVAETDMEMIASSGLKSGVHEDHAFFARADKYADARWDNAEITAKVQAYATEYFLELKGKHEEDGSTRHFQLMNIIKAA